tara:strand:- start:635 stop:1171 length:537 start_codon:yes stop_codon:yes gene_type:complete
MKKIILSLIFLFLFSCVSLEKEDEEIKTSENKIEYDDLVPPIKSWCLPHESDPHRVHLNFKNRVDFQNYLAKFEFNFDENNFDIEFAWYMRCINPIQEFIPFCLYRNIHGNKGVLNIRDYNWMETQNDLDCKDMHEGELHYLSFMLPSPVISFKKERNKERKHLNRKNIGSIPRPNLK